MKHNHQEVLRNCLDFLWERGLLNIDLEWLCAVDQRLSQTQKEDEITTPLVEQALNIVTQDFFLERHVVHQKQIDRLVRFLAEAENEDDV